MVVVKCRMGESADRALKILKKKLDREGVMRTVKSKRYHVKPSDAKRLKSKLAQKQRGRR